MPFSQIKDMIGLLAVKQFQRQVFDMMDDALTRIKLVIPRWRMSKLFPKYSKGKFAWIIP